MYLYRPDHKHELTKLYRIANQRISENNNPFKAEKVEDDQE